MYVRMHACGMGGLSYLCNSICISIMLIYKCEVMKLNKCEVINISYNGLSSRGANFHKFHKWPHKIYACLHTALAINTVDGRGLSYELRCVLLPKKSKVMLYLPFITR